MKKFNVLFWDFNSDMIKEYDVLPYFRKEYNELTQYHKKYKDDCWKIPKTLEDFKKFTEDHSKRRFWGRCEYEMVCHGWPIERNEYKLDIHEQIMMNIDIISEILYEELVLS